MWSIKHSRSFIQPSLIDTVSAWDRHGIGLLTGYSGIYYLSHLWQFSLVQSGYKIHNIDCAIRFDAYAIAEEALKNGISPEDIHDRITVSRCFTPYQILDEVNDIYIQENGLGKKPGLLCFILAPSKQFFDGDVSAEEGRFLLQKLISIFQSFQKKSIPLMIVEKENYNHPAFRTFYAAVQNMARPVFRLKVMEKEMRKFYSIQISSHTTGYASKKSFDQVAEPAPVLAASHIF